jgi:hypothetical protein
MVGRSCVGVFAFTTARRYDRLACPQLGDTPVACSSARFVAACFAAALGSGCATLTPTNPTSPIAQTPDGKQQAIRTPALVVVSLNGVLTYFPITSHGGRNSMEIARVPGVAAASSMVANGNVVTILDQAPARVVQYDIITKAKHVLPDPYGVPIDITIDKKANLYALNRVLSSASTVTVYRTGSSQPQELTCKYLDTGVAIATDNEGDVFVNGSGSAFTGVVEIPNGPNGPQALKCKKLALQPEEGYVAGLAIDPKTDDLVVLDDPGFCSGGIEGQMTIYPKPYKASTGRSVDLDGSCVGLMRLDAASRTVFAIDRTFASGPTFVIQRSYPGGQGTSTYKDGSVSGFTTIPNTLPN